MHEGEIKKNVRKGYAKVARKKGSCCDPSVTCCGGSDMADEISRRIGYSQEELSSVPEGANLGLGCGNPVALASLKKGEVVLDLGSGAGFDCFLAARKVGEKGRVIGVDMTPEMIDEARKNARKGNYKNVEFRLGEIENLPASDASVDVIISNCVINLSPDKKQVFKEAFRVLKPGGRIMISDIVLLKELPAFLRSSVEAYLSCVSGAIMKTEYLGTIREAGFKDVQVVDEVSYPTDFIDLADPTINTILKNLKISAAQAQGILGGVVSIKVNGFKPA